MHNTLKARSTRLALAAAITMAMASTAQAVDVTVVGRIIPATCTMTLTDPDIDFGTIPLDRISTTANSKITPFMSGVDARTTLNVACDAPAQLAVSFTDNRAGSVDNSVINVLPSATTTETFGLGVDTVGTNIGAYSLEGEGATVNGVAAKMLESTDGGATWSVPTSRRAQNTPGWWASWVRESQPDAPEPITSLAQIMEVNAGVVPSSSLDTTVPVVIDGSVTMELIYL